MAGRPDLVMLEPKRFSQPLVPPVLSVFCQVLNLHRSLLLTCTEESHAELIHPGAADLRLPVRPWRQQGPVSYLQHCAAGSSRCCRMSARQDRIQEMCARQPQLNRHVRPPAGRVPHHEIGAGSPEFYGCS